MKFTYHKEIRVSIRVTETFGQSRGRGLPCKNFLDIWLDHHAKFGCAVCRSPMKCDVLGPPPEMGAWQTPIETRPSPRVTIDELGRSESLNGRAADDRMCAACGVEPTVGLSANK